MPVTGILHMAPPFFTGAVQPIIPLNLSEMEVWAVPDSSEAARKVANKSVSGGPVDIGLLNPSPTSELLNPAALPGSL